MSMLDRLLDQLKKRGLTVRPGDRPGELRLTGNKEEMTPEILGAVKAFKPQLLERFGRPAGTPPAGGHA